MKVFPQNCSTLYYITSSTPENCKSKLQSQNSQITIESTLSSRQFCYSLLRSYISEWFLQIFVPIKSFGLSKSAFHGRKNYCAFQVSKG